MTDIDIYVPHDKNNTITQTYPGYSRSFNTLEMYIYMMSWSLIW